LFGRASALKRRYGKKDTVPTGMLNLEAKKERGAYARGLKRKQNIMRKSVGGEASLANPGTVKSKRKQIRTPKRRMLRWFLKGNDGGRERVHGCQKGKGLSLMRGAR